MLTGLKRRQITQSQPAAVMLASVKALIVANEFLEALVEGLRADVSKGYARRLLPRKVQDLHRMNRAPFPMNWYDEKADNPAWIKALAGQRGRGIATSTSRRSLSLSTSMRRRRSATGNFRMALEVEGTITFPDSYQSKRERKLSVAGTR